ncbi:MAG: hypothetical protein KDB23_26195 [Planctomycetales bacterium]|nr:hypothetical protein [Planctomycetales bacterium]
MPMHPPSQSLRRALRGGAYVYSSAVVANCPLWPNAARQARLDFVFADSEHTPVDRATLAWLCRAYGSVSIPVVVRIPSPDPFAASMVLDGGARGFIAPYIETVEQVEALTAVARYRPLKGARAAAAITDPKSLEPELRGYLEERNAETIFIANIESVPAIENLSALLSVGGIDAVLIGPHDLTCSLGIPEKYDHPRFDEAVRTIFRVAREHNVGAGVHFWTNMKQEIDWARTAGANLIMHSSDWTLYAEGLARDLTFLRGEIENRVVDESGDEQVIV